MRTVSLLIASCLLAACNPFTAKRGEAGQPCLDDDLCYQGLACVRDVCVEVIDCFADPPPDCSTSGPEGQGPDRDGDGWGECCDCRDDDPDVNPAVAELCNGIDDDCDGATDEDGVCPGCEVDADGDRYGPGCPAGPDCDDGDWNVHPGAAEVCNAVDDDCDGETDEALAPRPCALTEGVCQGVQDACLADGTWSGCDYGPDHTPGEDALCDGLDNDCDGQTDEEALQLVPEDGAQATDGLDNNCNGLVDEPGGVLVPLPGYLDIWVGAYEVTVFDSPDCMGNRYGEASDDYPIEWPTEGDASVDLYACSLPGLVPSGYLSWYRARRACLAQGMRLCNKVEWGAACTGGQARSFPYGPQLTPSACNDMQAGAGQVEPTGTREGCTAGMGTWDMSGNLEEWVFDEYLRDPSLRMRGGGGYGCELCDDDSNCWPCGDKPDDEERIQELTNCYIQNDGNAACLPEWAKPWYGTRCCYEPE